MENCRCLVFYEILEKEIIMELKQRDYALTEVLNKLDINEKEELAKALGYMSLVELFNDYEYKDDVIALEEAIRYEGSDWIWHGVFGDDWATYKEIVRSVADFQKVKYTDSTEIEELEKRIIISVIDKAWQQMSEEQKREYEKAICEYEEQMKAEDPEKLKELLNKFKVTNLRGISPAVLLSMGLAFKMGGFLSYQILVIVMGAIARTLGVRIAMQSVTRLAFYAVPILNIILSIWLAWDVRNWICGPAMRKIAPAVFMIGVARIKQKG